jgi:hypothetical protein
MLKHWDETLKKAYSRENFIKHYKIGVQKYLDKKECPKQVLKPVELKDFCDNIENQGYSFIESFFFKIEEDIQVLLKTVDRMCPYIKEQLPKTIELR